MFCHLATVSRTGDPRSSPLWYHWEDEALWIIADDERTYTTRIERHPAVAVSVVDFDPTTGRVVHVGMRGTASLEPLDDGIVRRKLTRYLGPDSDAWDPMFHGLDPDRWHLIRVDPETVVARDQTYAGSLSST